MPSRGVGVPPMQTQTRMPAFRTAPMPRSPPPVGPRPGSSSRPVRSRTVRTKKKPEDELEKTLRELSKIK